MKFLDTKLRYLKMFKEPEDTIAPDGRVWVCLACGKYTKDKFGSDMGWDVSCVLNSVLCNVDELVYENGRVSKIESTTDVKEKGG